MAKGEVSARAGLVELEGRWRTGRLAATVVVVAVVIQAQMMAYGNRNLWRPEISITELAVGLVAALAANLWLRRVEAAGRRWADRYVEPGSGLMYDVLRNLPAAALTGALMAVLLAVPNAGIIPQVIYRDAVDNVVASVIVRAISDLPTTIGACLAVRLVAERLYLRKSA